jgi:hypothetical protein
MVAYDHPARVVVWDVSSATRAWVFFSPAMVWGTTWSPDGRAVLVGDLEGAIRVWDLTAPPED